MALDTRAFRDALGCFGTGVTVVTTIGRGDEPVGVTASSFNAVSLDPPLVLFSLDRGANSLAAFLAGTHFAVNVLGEGQAHLSRRFAMAASDKWNGIAYETWETGCPILADALANFECRVRHAYDGGDHVIFVGEVTRMRSDPDGRPLLFFRGRYCGLDEAP